MPSKGDDSMELAQLSIEELTELEKILQLDQNISNIYDKLCELEVNRQKESEEYEQLRIKLTAEITHENEILQNPRMAYERCLKYCKLISDKLSIDIADNSIFTTLKNYDSRVLRRLQLTLRTKIRLNPEYQKYLLSEATKMKNIPDPLHDFSDNIRIDYELSNDINSIFLSILEDSLAKPHNKEYRPQLTKAKYCISLVYKELESILLAFKFTMQEHVYINSKIIVEMLKRDKEAYDSIKYSKLKVELSTQINRLLEIDDTSYNTPNTNVNLIISSYYLRALLSLMTPAEIDTFKREFSDKITSLEYLQSHPNHRISESVIVNCFRYFNHDREKNHILSLKSE